LTHRLKINIFDRFLKKSSVYKTNFALVDEWLSWSWLLLMEHLHYDNIKLECMLSSVSTLGVMSSEKYRLIDTRFHATP